MALQAWFPLNKDINNKGLVPSTSVNNGATLVTDGKFGKSYSFGGSQYIDTGFAENFGTGDFTLCAWVYIVQTANKTYQCIVGNKGTPAASVGCCIYWNQNQKKFLWSTANGSSSCEIWTTDTFDSIIYNSWHHIAMVRNNQDSKKGYFYIDGVRKEIASVATVLDVTASATMKIGTVIPTNSAYYYTGKVNDVRIYNHAISDQDAKDLYWGKVLDFNGVDWTMPAHNNTWNSLTGFNSCYNAATGSYGFNTGTSVFQTCYYEKDKFGADTPVIKVYTTTDKPEAYPYVYFDAAYLAPTSAAGETFRCLSFDYWPYSRDKVQFYSYRSGYVVKYLKADGTWSNWAGTCTIPVTLKSWNHITITWAYSGATQENMGSGPGYMQIGNQKAATNTSDYWLFKNIQVEKSEEPTPYSRFSRDIMTMDRSAMLYPLYTGDVVVSGDSAYFKGTAASCVSGTTLGLKSGGTLSVWFNCPKPTSNQWLYTDPTSRMCLSFYSNGTYIIPTIGTTTGNKRYLTTGINWGSLNNVITTYNPDTTVAQTYINGVAATQSGSDYWSNGTNDMGKLKIGGFISNGYAGYINSVQVFASMFTADDAMALYKKGPQKKEDYRIIEMWRNMYMSYSGCTWLKVLHHNTPSTQLFTAANGANNDDPNLFSKLYLFNDPNRFKGTNGKYEFMVREKLESNSDENIGVWTQTSSPTANTIAGYTQIYSSTGSWPRSFGLTHQSANAVFDDSGTSTWWCACGCNAAHQSGIPGFFGVVKTGYLDLYIKVDDTNYLK